MAYTQADLVKRIAAELRALGTGQNVEIEDEEQIELMLPGIIAEVAGLNIFYIADADSVPDAAFPAFVAYAAAILAPSYGLGERPAERAMAEDRLRVLQRIGKGTGGPLTVDTALKYRRRRSIF